MIPVTLDLTELCNQTATTIELLTGMKDHDPDKVEMHLQTLIHSLGSERRINNNVLHAQLLLLNATLRQLAKATAEMDANVPQQEAGGEEDEGDEYEAQMYAAIAAAREFGWPPTLVKSMDDSYNYLIKIRGESTTWQYESAQMVSPDIVRLSGVEWDNEHYNFHPRDVDVCVDDISWVTDAQS